MVMDFPNPKELMAKKKAAKEAEKTAAAAAAAATASALKAIDPVPFPVLESSPEPPAKPASPIAKKRKAIEKGKKKLPAKRSKKSKVSTPEADDEGPKVEVNLPLRARLLQDRQTSVGIMHQLLSDADAETLSQGPLQAHIDDLLWDGLKTNIRAMGLMKRTNDKNVELRARLIELEARDKKRGEMLQNIERKFGDIKASADGLTANLKDVMHQANEGTSMMGVMVDRFDEAQAKIKSLETENAALATQILDAFEKATIKARYDLLKEYKQGLFVDAEIDEELELYRDEMEGPSIPVADTEPTSNDPGQEGVEPRDPSPQP